MTGLVELQTSRLRLRPFSIQDFEELHEFASDFENVEHMDWGPNSEAQSRQFLIDIQQTYLASPRTEFEFAVVLKSSSALIGSCGIRVKSTSSRSGDFGYILNKRYWRQGLGFEIAKALIQFGFEDLKLHRIWATCSPKNTASKYLLEKAGLKFEGKMRENLLVRGLWRDSLLFSILEDEYQRT